MSSFGLQHVARQKEYPHQQHQVLINSNKRGAYFVHLFLLITPYSQKPVNSLKACEYRKFPYQIIVNGDGNTHMAAGTSM